MSFESNDNSDVNSYEYKLTKVSNDEIISILRYREHFQPNAVKAAIKEALNRGIIQSVDELDNDEFKPQQMPPRSMFPLANTLNHNTLLLRSLCRIFYGFGLIPIVYGLIRYSVLGLIISSIAFISGLLILYVAYQLNKTYKSLYAYLILSLNIPAVSFSVYFLLQKGAPAGMDIFATVVINVIVLYTTIYAHKIAILSRPSAKINALRTDYSPIQICWFIDNHVMRAYERVYF
jgi:hypothetical protein